MIKSLRVQGKLVHPQQFKELLLFRRHLHQKLPCRQQLPLSPFGSLGLLRTHVGGQG